MKLETLKKCKNCEKPLHNRGKFKTGFCVKCYMVSDLNPGKNPTLKQKLSQLRKGVPLSEETRKKQSISLKKTLARPEIRQKWSLVKLGKRPTEETRRKLSAYQQSRPKK